MRYVVLIIGLAGLVGLGVLGYIWMDNFNELKEDMEQKRKNIQNREDMEQKRKNIQNGVGPPEDRAKVAEQDRQDRAKVAEQDRRGRAWPFLMAGAGLGLFGSLLAYERYRFCGAALLLAAPVGALVLHPFEFADFLHPLDHYELIFASGLVLAGLLALFIRPRASVHSPAREPVTAN